MTELPLTEQDPMDTAAAEAAEVLKALSNPARLRLLCALVQGPRTVGQLEHMLGQSQSYVSGQLLKLRDKGLVRCDPRGRERVYAIEDARVGPILERLYEVFCDVQTGPLLQDDADHHGHQAQRR